MLYEVITFVPGDPARAAAARADGLSSPYTVTPNSDNVKELLVAAFKDKDPYLMGVAAHAFADSWAHQNFCGLQDATNDIGASGAAAGLPPAGHLQALSSPDEPDGVWLDRRLKAGSERIVNRERFAAAAIKLYRYLRVYLGKPFSDDELVVARLEAVWSKPSKDDRITSYNVCYTKLLRPPDQP